MRVLLVPTLIRVQKDFTRLFQHLISLVLQSITMEISFRKAPAQLNPLSHTNELQNITISDSMISKLIFWKAASEVRPVLGLRCRVDVEHIC
jgi:hypothetical protein